MKNSNGFHTDDINLLMGAIATGRNTMAREVYAVMTTPEEPQAKQLSLWDVEPAYDYDDESEAEFEYAEVAEYEPAFSSPPPFWSAWSACSVRRKTRTPVHTRTKE